MQLPLIPGWAFMDYKVQGMSLDSVVVDLSSACGLQHVYVMLSCAKGLRHLGILHWFPPHRVFSRIQEDLQIELCGIQDLDHLTTEIYQCISSTL